MRQQPFLDVSTLVFAQAAVRLELFFVIVEQKPLHLVAADGTSLRIANDT